MILSASKVRQSLRSLWGSFGLRGLNVPSDFFEKHHSPVAEFRSLWMSFGLHMCLCVADHLLCEILFPDVLMS